jgi:nucleoside 2-deoxyribosyltransferase
MKNRVYLAGPEVFLSDAREIAEKKKAICRDRGLVGVFPIDSEVENLQAMPPAEAARTIYASNLARMNSCASVIANLTPFRGVSLDAGTAYEVGYMASLGRLVLGYTNVLAAYSERASLYYRDGAGHAIESYSAGTSIENFGLAENLMIECAVRACGGTVVVTRVAAGSELSDLQGFAECAAQAQRLLNARSAGPSTGDT